MTAARIVEPAGVLGEALSGASPDLMRHLLGTVINSLLSAEADAVCGAEGSAPPRNVSTSATATGTGTWIPGSARSTSRSPSCARGPTSLSGCYLLGVSTRRMDKLVESLGITSLAKSQVSRMAADLDEQVAAFRTRSLADAGPFTFVAADALTMKVREGGRVVNAVVFVAIGVNADGHREVLGVKVATTETKEAWNVFFADLLACGLAGVRLVTSDAHAGLLEAIAANLPGASWQRCGTHYAANLMSTCPKSSWPAVKAMLHSVYDPEAVHAQFDKLLDHVATPLPAVAEHLHTSASVVGVASWPAAGLYVRAVTTEEHTCSTTTNASCGSRQPLFARLRAMTLADSSAVRFDRPPIKQVELSTYFVTDPPLQSVHVAPLHQVWHAQFPEAVEHPPYAQELPDDDRNDQEFGSTWPLPYTSYRREQRSISFQSDRFEVRWGFDPGALGDYVGFEALRDDLRTKFHEFTETLASQSVSLVVKRVSCRYVNEVDLPAARLAAGVITGWLAEPEASVSEAAYVGVRLHTCAGPKNHDCSSWVHVDSGDSTDASTLTIIVSHDLSPENSDATVAISAAHDELIGLFLRYTSEEQHRGWGRRR